MQQFKRNIYPKLLEEFKNDKICVIFGARQVGKSYLMNKLYKEHKNNAAFFDLEQPEVISLFAESEIEIKNLLLESGRIIFVDEFHYIENASYIFKAIYDLGKRDIKHKTKIIASGSSAIEMHKHLKESLAGRINKYYLRPLTLEEYLKNEIGEPDEYFIYGGLPEVYSLEKKDRPKLLAQIVSSYIQKDVKSLIQETNIAAFNKLIFMLANVNQAIPVSSFSRELGLSVNTVQSYLDILEQSFVIYSLHSYSTNLSNELKKSKKYYFYDLGIRNSLLKNFQPISSRSDKGLVYESYVMQYLVSIVDKSTSDLFFWRTTKQDEVDFIWLINQVTIPIEVKSTIEKDTLPDGLRKFISAYPASPFAIVVYSKSKTLENMTIFNYKGKKIYYVDIQNLEYLSDILVAEGCI